MKDKKIKLAKGGNYKLDSEDVIDLPNKRTINFICCDCGLTHSVVLEIRPFSLFQKIRYRITRNYVKSEINRRAQEFNFTE